MQDAEPQWRPDRAAGLTRLDRFLPRAGRDYARNRNSDTGPGERDNVSLLSPYLRHRLLEEEEVLQATVRQHTPAAAEKFIQEVFWRSYFKGWLEQHPGVWRRYRADVVRLLDELDGNRPLRERVAAAEEGRSGIDCMDAWAQELVDTGYLHNHARMWFASIWVYTLGLPWQLGADFFYRHLVDGDPASNTLSWRWVCGLHTRGKTYLARASNIARYTDGRFAPVGLADAAPALHEDPPPQRVPLLASGPTVNGERFGLLITEEDGRPESLPLPAAPSALLSVTATAARSPRPVGERAASFAGGAVRDARARGEAHFALSGDDAGETADWGARLVRWAADRQLDAIVCAYAPVGPVAERLADAQSALAQAGVALCSVHRSYDEAAWPHASRGFFKLKKAIPLLLPV